MRKRLPGVACGAVSGVLYALCHPPLAWSWLAFLALVPLLFHVRARGGRNAFLPFFVFGVVSQTIGLSWLGSVITPVGTFLLSVLLTLLFVVWIGVFTGELLRRGWSLLVGAPLAWVAWEWIRNWLFTGFPWLYVCHSQADWTTFIQGADLLGGGVITAAVVLVNAGVAEAIFAARAGRGSRSLLALAPGAALVGLLLAYGTWRLPRVGLREGPAVLLVQGNVPQLMKTEALRRGQAERSRFEILTDQNLMTREALAAHPEAEVVIWAETMFPYPFTDEPGPTGDRQRRTSELALDRLYSAAGGRPAIVGALHRSEDGEVHNSAFLFVPSGEREAGRRRYVLEARYDKVHAVPGSEYIPLRTIVPEGLVKSVGDAIRNSAGYVPDLTEGDELVLFDAAGVRFGPLICYEICFPALVRQVCDEGADVLLNLSNYGWFPGTHQPDQANQMATLRAVETRRPVVVSANTGISGVISPRGEIEELVVDGRKRDVGGAEVFRVPLSGTESLFRRIQGLPPLAALLACIVLGLLRRRRDGAVD